MANMALAQNTVSVRGGDHAGYSRIVFDWSESTGYKISKSAGVLTLSFEKAASLDLSEVTGANLKNIGAVQATSNAGENLTATLQIKPESKFRDFKIGKRVIVDVYDAAGILEKKPAESKPVDKKTEKVIESAKVEAPKEVTLKEVAPETLPEEEKVALPEEEQNHFDEYSLSGLEPHVITLTSTESVGLAAFERAGFLWLVFDDPALKTTPVLAGPQKDKMPKLEKIALNDGVAYRLPLPKGYNVYGEGGGLLWRVILTPNPRRVTPVVPKVDKINAADIHGGKLIWPFKSARKIIKLTDPLVGDEITAVTTEGSEGFSGEARQYVHLETLSSMVGLGFIAKSDDVTATKIPDGVEITRPQGLALSSTQDTALAVLQDDIAEEQEFFEADAKTSNLSLIYDFKRWEMGGKNAFDKNRQILMRGAANKKDSAQVEDVLTLAKLNLANNRGPEALGLLRVAALALPGIDENAEFIALRGAAAALADKYDEAIEDFANPALKDYTETGYWRAYTLAGLEDWQQADAVLPTDFDTLETYPIQIQKPLALRLAEISLRAGKIQQAKALLELLEPAFSSLSLPQQSAWKYLNGELERQEGNDDAAIENWQSLITGKDDYYRAKAGLSLTKLQLERQKITPAKAIDRLEGLRYAWRGDELEMLINYRLGEVYIENNDYLKGLSVLRNTISLSPETPMAREVTDYMTTTFRNLFTDGTLNKISPIEAVSIYDEFKELTPIGEEGDVFVQNLAERLVDVDLLGRASEILDYQLTHRLKGVMAAQVATRLAAIQLMDGKPDAAIKTLDRAEEELNATSEFADKAGLSREAKLLRARALSKINRESEALKLLQNISKGEDSNRLRADIAWNAGQWDQASAAFDDLIAGEDISLTRPADEYETNLILNGAIALNLSGDRTALNDFRTRYQDLMAQTPKGKIFDVVTRPRQLGMLDSQDSITSLISEVDLFGEFLENYKKSE